MKKPHSCKEYGSHADWKTGNMPFSSKLSITCKLISLRMTVRMSMHFSVSVLHISIDKVSAFLHRIHPLSQTLLHGGTTRAVSSPWIQSMGMSVSLYLFTCQFIDLYCHHYSFHTAQDHIQSFHLITSMSYLLQSSQMFVIFI